MQPFRIDIVSAAFLCVFTIWLLKCGSRGHICECANHLKILFSLFMLRVVTISEIIRLCYQVYKSSSSHAMCRIVILLSILLETKTMIWLTFYLSIQVKQGDLYIYQLIVLLIYINNCFVRRKCYNVVSQSILKWKRKIETKNYSQNWKKSLHLFNSIHDLRISFHIIISV